MWPFSKRNKDKHDEMVEFQGKMISRESMVLSSVLANLKLWERDRQQKGLPLPKRRDHIAAMNLRDVHK